MNPTPNQITECDDETTEKQFQNELNQLASKMDSQVVNEKSYPNARDCEYGQLRRSCPHCEYDRDMQEAHEKIDLLQRQNDELKLIKQRYENLIFAVGNKYPDESRHETALRYIRQAENKSHQSCGAGKSEHSKAIDDALCHGVGVMSIGVEGSKHVPHDEVFDRQQQTNGE